MPTSFHEVWRVLVRLVPGDTPPRLLADLPSGLVRRLPTAGQRPAIVLTTNACTAYLEDLWELGPLALVVLLPTTPSGLAMRASADLDHAGVPALPRCQLTPAERGLLRLVAHGHRNTGRDLQTIPSAKSGGQWEASAH